MSLLLSSCTLMFTLKKHHHSKVCSMKGSDAPPCWPPNRIVALHGGSIKLMGNVHGLVQVGAGEGSSASMSGRVKRLEEKIPELQTKLRKHMKHAHGAAEGGSTKGLNGRVEVLEEAVDALLEAQVSLTLFVYNVARTEGSFCLLYTHALGVVRDPSQYCGLDLQTSLASAVYLYVWVNINRWVLSSRNEMCDICKLESW